MAVRIITAAWIIGRVVERIPFLDHRIGGRRGRLKIIYLRGVGEQSDLRRLFDSIDVQRRLVRGRRKKSVVAVAENDVRAFQFEMREIRAERGKEPAVAAVEIWKERAA